MSALREFARSLELASKEIDILQKEVLNLQANVFLAEVVQATPVNKIVSAKTRGQLKRNWNMGRIETKGITKSINVYNNTRYASWVELGHRKADKTGWVEGQFFMENTKNKVENDISKISAPAIKNFFNKRLVGGADN